jgi:hypothetical protein
MWMSSLSLEDDTTPYYQQKEYECQALEKRISLGLSATDGNSSVDINNVKKRAPKTCNTKLETKVDTIKKT